MLASTICTPAKGIDSAAPTPGSITLAPELTAIQFATPDETGFDYFEAWVEYRVNIVDEHGDAIAPWRFTGYGQAPHERFSGLDEGLSGALTEAIRNAGAKLATGLPEHAPLDAYLGKDTR